MQELRDMHNWNINPQTLMRVSNQVWMYWKDLDGCYLGCNELMAKTLKLSSTKDIVNKFDFELGISDHEAEYYRQCDNQVIVAGIPMQFCDTATLSQKKIEFNVIKTPLYENKKLIGILGLSYYSPQNNSNQIIIDGIVLSPRESQILKELVRGKLTKEIANKLGISFRTVEDYLANIKRKLDVPSKSKLIEKVFDHIV